MFGSLFHHSSVIFSAGMIHLRLYLFDFFPIFVPYHTSKAPIKSVERHLSELSRVGMVRYQGSKKTGGYYLVNQDNDL